MNCVLGRLQFEEQLMKIIPKVENIFKHKYDQSDAVRGIKAMRSKQYDQQYNQDKLGGGNDFIASSTYAKTKDLSKKPNIQKIDIGR